MFDSHAHLQDTQIKKDLDNIITRARDAGVARITCIGYDMASSEEALQIARKYKHVYATVGVHPHDAKTFKPEVRDKLKALARDPKVVAIGEIGLDYYRDLSPREKQKESFIEQILLAQEIGKPIVIHDRDANQDVMDIIKKYKAGRNGGIMHCYSGSLPLALEAVKNGFYISFAGPITYKNARKSHEVVVKIPMDRLLVETDCPYLTPEPLRGRINEPANVRYTVEKMAALRNQHPDEVGYLTERNACKIYRIKD
ncbi:MAG: TatD family hydrolase [Syntrophomonadaceae bacterium]